MCLDTGSLMPREALTPSMGAMSRSYRARSGGLAKELCLRGRDEVPSLMGDMVLLNKLVMLWQLLWREGVRDEPGPCGRWGHQPPSQPWHLSSLPGGFHVTVSTLRHCGTRQLHTIVSISVGFSSHYQCPKVLFRGFNYMLCGTIVHRQT